MSVTKVIDLSELGCRAVPVALMCNNDNHKPVDTSDTNTASQIP